jgi:hypothetical protein
MSTVAVSGLLATLVSAIDASNVLLKANHFMLYAAPFFGLFSFWGAFSLVQDGPPIQPLNFFSVQLPPCACNVPADPVNL